MPNKSGKNKNKKRKNGNSRNAFRLGFLRMEDYAFIQLQIANTKLSNGFLVVPNVFSRASAICPMFEYYRAVGLRIDVEPIVRFETSVNNDSTCNSGVIGYYPEVTNATLSALTFADVAALIPSKSISMTVVALTAAGANAPGAQLCSGENKTVRFIVPRKSLLGTPTKWFRNATVTSYDVSIVQGTILFAVLDSAGANTIKINLHLRVVWEFRGPCTATLTKEMPWRPVMRIHASQDKQPEVPESKSVSPCPKSDVDIVHVLEDMSILGASGKETNRAQP